MRIDDLNDDEAFDPEKLFDEEQYSTLIIKRDGFSKKQNTAADLIESLLEPGITRPEYEEIFAELKKTNARQMLVEAISQTTSPRERKLLVAACWETGLDFSPNFLFFADLVLSSGLEIALEAFTVIEEMGNLPSEADVSSVMKKIDALPEQHVIVTDLRNYLENLRR